LSTFERNFEVKLKLVLFMKNFEVKLKLFLLFKVQHVESSPPYIMDHCYARPAPVRSRRASSSSNPDTGSAAGGGGGAFDHDYTKPRTPPRAVLAPAAVNVPPAAAVADKKPLALAAAFGRKAALPSQPVKFAVRDMKEKFDVLYKFLTEGIDLEDVMYLKRSYEMVSTVSALIGCTMYVQIPW
jgi:hypothetical protein